MKKLTKLFSLLLVAAVLFSGCHHRPTPTGESTAPAQDTASTDATEASTPQTQPPTEVTAPSETAPAFEYNGKPVDAAVLAEITALFDDPYSWYSGAALSQYTMATFVNLYQLFYPGFSDEPVLTDAEKAFLATTDFAENVDVCHRLPVSKMSTVLNSLFEYPFGNYYYIGIENLVYWEETNSYYTPQTDTARLETVIAGVYQDDYGRYNVYYSFAPATGETPQYVMQLWKRADGYTIASNRSTNKHQESTPQPQIPQEGTPLSEDVLAEFNTLFLSSLDPTNCWYNMALNTYFDNPENLNLRQFFYNGIRDETLPTDEDRQWMLDTHGVEFAWDLAVVPANEADAILECFFGLTWHETNRLGEQHWKYNPATNNYLKPTTDAWVLRDLDFDFVGGAQLDDGTIRLYYTMHYPWTENMLFAITMEDKAENGEMGYYILSNLPVQ